LSAIALSLDQNSREPCLRAQSRLQLRRFIMRTISEAVILMAGRGSRLQTADQTLPKPLVPIGARPLISYTIESLQKLGVRTIHAVIGANGDALLMALRALVPQRINLNPIRNPDWQKQNGVSLLCAKDHVAAPFLLAMGDHLFDSSIFERLLKGANPDRLSLAVDRKISAIFDLADATKVQVRGRQLVAIGKEVPRYDAIDTGLFLCPNEIFSYLHRAKHRDDCSLSDGVRLMARDGKADAIDIGDGWWQDVDTPEMLQHAEEHFANKASELTRAK
jgi:choline kinase